jgi:phosphatidylinositol 4-kinase
VWSTLQVIKLLHDAFEAAGLSLYLRPYGCLPTGYECGIIEVGESQLEAGPK